MEEKLVITHKKYSGQSSVVSVRLPNDMLAAIDAVAAKTGRTRNEVIAMSLEFSLERMVLEEKV